MMTHVLRYLLIHGDRKKKVELEVAQGVENIEVETLRHRARELFGLHAVLLQIWDKGFEDWVDLDDGDASPTNSRIKVELDKNAKVTPVAHHQKTSAAVVSVTESAGRHAAPSKTQEELSQHRPLAVSSMPQVHTLPSRPVASVSSGHQMLRPTVSAVQQLHTLCQSHLPQPASSAQEPQGAAAKLRAGLTLTNGERSHLMDCVYKSVTPYTFYPTAYEYRFLTEMFLNVFPQLYDQAGPSENRENQIDTWKQRLMNKFKNNRKRQDRDIPVVRLHKRVRMNLDPSSHMGHGYDVIDVEEVDDEEEYVADEEAKEHGVVIKQEDCDLDDVYHVMPADTTEFSETGS
ncbi:uncharacterized protein [Diadema antillarum]|uniref:uncharacterized protein n=1 Tax=Diadema antillarum TaxID=105358 RepID=UPI003A8B652A